MNERTEDRQLEFPTVPQLFAAGRTQKRANAKDSASDTGHEEVPLSANKIADINKKLCARGKFGSKISENFAQDRDNAHDQEGSNGECNADHDDGIGRGRCEFLPPTRAGFDESGQAVDNFSEQPSMLTRLHRPN